MNRQKMGTVPNEVRHEPRRDCPLFLRPSQTRLSASPNRGYILLETTVALLILSVGAYAVHGAFQQAAIARGQAADYTEARFLLEQTLSEIEAKPLIEAGAATGTFDDPHDRFRWSSEVRKLPLPAPRDLRSRTKQPFRYPKGRDYLVRIAVTVTWERAGQSFSESLETLLGPERLWEPNRAG